eukprot:11037861-Alexandrium_andersonii.AAC.1
MSYLSNLCSGNSPVSDPSLVAGGGVSASSNAEHANRGNTDVLNWRQLGAPSSGSSAAGGALPRATS